jgi:hypothetical protein
VGAIHAFAADIADLDAFVVRARHHRHSAGAGAGAEGWYVGRRVREMKSDVLIVYISGASAHIRSTEATENSIIVSKPFAVGAVVDAMSKLAVLEIVSMTSLALALEAAHSEKNNAGKDVLNMTRVSVDQKCEEMVLSPRATKAAHSYVEELVITAIYSLHPAPL